MDRKHCPNCMASYASSRGLKIHMGYCKVNTATVKRITDNPSYSMLGTHPLLSIATDRRLPSQKLYDPDCYSSNVSDGCNVSDGDDGVDSTSAGNSEKSTSSTRSTLTGAKKRIQTMAVTKLQVNLNNLIIRNKASLGMYDDICQLFNDYVSSGGFEKYAKLKNRKPFLRSIESLYNTQSLRPRNCTVKLHNNLVTVPVFDIKAMIISLLSDNSLMDKNNFAEGYNIFNGDVYENLTPNMVRCILETHGCLHKIDTAKQLMYWNQCLLPS